MIPGHTTDPDVVRNIIGDALWESPLPPSLDCTLAACEPCGRALLIDSGQRALMAEFEATDLDYVTTCMACRPGLGSEMEEVFIRDAGNAASALSLMRGAHPRQTLTVVTVAELKIIRRQHPQVFALPLRWD